jgi:TRAP-type mannitol/chloroaromatic compound transport system permease small subunit
VKTTFVQHRPAPKVLEAINRGSSVLMVISGIALVIMLGLIASDVFLRNIFGVAVTGVAEYVSQWMMPATILFAMAFTERKKDHIRVTIVEDSLMGRPQQVFAAMGQSLAVIISVILAWGSLNLSIESMGIRETVPMGTGELAVWPIKLIIVAAWIWVAVQAFANLMTIMFPRWTGESSAGEQADGNLKMEGSEHA